MNNKKDNNSNILNFELENSNNEDDAIQALHNVSFNEMDENVRFVEDDEEDNLNNFLLNYDDNDIINIVSVEEDEYEMSGKEIVASELNHIINSLNLGPHLSEGFKKLLFIGDNNNAIVQKNIKSKPDATESRNSNEQSSLNNEIMANNTGTTGSNDSICGSQIVHSEALSDKEKVKENKVQVYIILCPELSVISVKIFSSDSIEKIISPTIKELEIPMEYLNITVNNKRVDSKSMKNSLTDFESDVNQAVIIEINSTNGNYFPIVTDNLKERIKFVESLVTTIKSEKGKKRLVVVEIDRKIGPKPFLGGFRHKKTFREYHNAGVQTPQLVDLTKFKEETRSTRSTRDTQTYEMHHNYVQTFNTTSTQMTRPYCYVSNITDKLITPGRYETADEREQRILKHVIILQRNIRRWLACNYTKRLRVEVDEHKSYILQLETEKEAEREAKKYKRALQRMHPKSRQDFDLLYSALEKWRLEELAKINETLTGAERKAALYKLLEEECELLSAIDRHKKEVYEDNKMRNTNLLLGKAANIKQWKREDGKLLILDTLGTQKGRHLLEIFTTLNMKFITDEARLDILLTVKNLMLMHPCKLATEIIDLVKREGTLMLRGIKEKTLEGLRRRISTLFLHFCKMPQNNPEIAKLLTYPPNPLDLRGNIYRCRYCERFLNSDEFPVGIIKFTIRVCRHCIRLNNIACRRIDFSPFSYLLENLRRSELSIFGDDSPRIAFLVNRDDIRYLVEMIWNKKSVLSGFDDLYELRLVRWRIEEEWSPWNTVLLTKSESEAHCQLTSLQKTYGDMLLNHILQKHSVAETYYARLKPLAAELTAKRVVLDNQPFNRRLISDLYEKE